MDWQATLKTLAPTVLSAALGPLGGIAISAIGSVLGVSDATQEKVAQAITSAQMTPEQVGQLRDLELKYKQQEQELGFKYADLEFKREALVVEDRKDARNMQIATHSKMPAVLTILVTAGFFGVLSWLLMHPELKSNETMLVLIGQLSTVWASCIAFYVSTTYSSARKDQLLANAPPPK